MRERADVVVIGAGIGGLAAAARLAAAGARTVLLDPHGTPGGKMRAIPTAAGPADAGPTVLTMPEVFEDLFAACGERLSDHVTLRREPLLARHFWPDGARLDLTWDEGESAANVAAAFGDREARAFGRFAREMRALFEAFEAPMMDAADPSPLGLAGAALSRPGALGTLLPGRSMARDLAARFRSPHLRQLFGRYATYVGGRPDASPALLGLVFHAEARGVWRCAGGMHALAAAVADLARAKGCEMRLGLKASGIAIEGGRAVAVDTPEGRIDAGAVLFAGDPRALHLGLLGEEARAAVRPAGVATRSLSANVWSFAARLSADLGLAHHNVFFCEDEQDEFGPLAAGRPPEAPTLYVCAQDRTQGARPAGAERFEIIANAPPLTSTHPPKEPEACRRTTLSTLTRFGLSFDPAPTTASLATPETFERLSPGSAGALYGRSPHGMLAALARPRARSRVPGLFLAGGGTHPGAGVPMSARSGRHAAEAIMRDPTSTWTSRPTATAGGTSTASRTEGWAAE